MSQIDITIIIPTYNRKNMLKKCLHILLTQNYFNEKYEVIVVDDGSRDGTKEVVRAFNNPQLRYYWQENKGPGAAINAGARIAKGDILAFTEDDCIVSKDWLK